MTIREIGKKITGGIRDIGQKVIGKTTDTMKKLAHTIALKLREMNLKPSTETIKKILIGMGVWIAPWALMRIAEEVKEIVSMGPKLYLEYLNI